MVLKITLDEEDLVTLDESADAGGREDSIFFWKINILCHIDIRCFNYDACQYWKGFFKFPNVSREAVFNFVYTSDSTTSQHYLMCFYSSCVLFIHAFLSLCSVMTWVFYTGSLCRSTICGHTLHLQKHDAHCKCTVTCVWQ